MLHFGSRLWSWSFLHTDIYIHAAFLLA
jgi:hypothetical protein